MRRTCCLLFCCFLCSFLVAQNWQPLNASEVFNFRLDQSDVVSASIWVDSSAQIGSDSVFYLNRVVKRLDDCLALTNNGAACDTCCFTKNGANFLQQTAWKRANGSWLFAAPDTFVILPQAILNDSWMLDSAQSITATVVQVYADSIFNLPDSVKAIALSSGDTLLLSQNHGLLQYPNGFNQTSQYALTGIEGRDLGEVLPGFSEIFGFQVGDRFEIDHSFANGPPLETYARRTKFVVDSRAQSGDTLTVSVSGVERFTLSGYYSNSSSVNPNYNRSFTLMDSADHLANGHPGQLLINPGQRVDNYLEGVPFISFPTPGAELYDFVELDRDARGNLIKRTGYATPQQGDVLVISSVNPDILIPSTFAWYHMEYTTGIATSFYNWWDFESYGTWGIVAYAKAGGDTVGIFTDDSILLNRDTEPTNLDLALFPNPVQNQLNLHSAQALEGNIQLANLQGQVMLQQAFSGTDATLDLGHIPAGLYVLQINSSYGQTTKRIHVIK